jgi:hypothetical protein
MRRRDLLSALAATVATLALPSPSRASSALLEADVAVCTVPLLEAIRQGEEGRLIMHAIPRTEVPIREVTYSIYKGVVGEAEEPEVLIGPERRVPFIPAQGEHHAPLLVPREARRGPYFVRWRIVTDDGHVMLTDHPFWVKQCMTRLQVTYEPGNFYSPELSTDFLEMPETLEERRQYYRFFYDNEPGF